MSSQGTNQSIEESVNSKVSVGTELIYALPKVYNGKTVNDLFPEFKHNSVLRFSKLFGLGRQTSLPKIWKGTRKRKKNKTNGNDRSADVTMKEENSTELPNNNNQNNDVDEVFKMLDDALKPNENKETKIDGMTEESQSGEEKKSGGDKSNEAEKEEHYDVQYEEDDEIRFMKPFYVLDDSEQRNNAERGSNELESNNELDPSSSTWRFGPASLWYDLLEPSAYIIEKKPPKSQKKVNIQTKIKK